MHQLLLLIMNSSHAKYRFLNQSINDPWNFVQDKVEELLIQDVLIFTDEIFLAGRLACAFLDRVRPWTEVRELSLESIEDFLRRLGIRLNRGERQYSS
jgi:hypothetical protein